MKIDKIINEFYKEIKKNHKVITEEYDDINELEAEIVGQGIPYNKIFTDKGNLVPKDEFDKSEWKKLLGEVIASIKKYGLIDKFSPDKNGDDIKPYRKGLLKLTADDGTEYIYNITTKRIEKA